MRRLPPSLAAYLLSWNVRVHNMSRPARPELDRFGRVLLDLRYRTTRSHESRASTFVGWSFAVIDDLRPREERALDWPGCEAKIKKGNADFPAKPPASAYPVSAALQGSRGSPAVSSAIERHSRRQWWVGRRTRQERTLRSPCVRIVIRFETCMTRRAGSSSLDGDPLRPAHRRQDQSPA